MIFEIPMSNKGKPFDRATIEDLWVDKYIDIDARNLVDVQIAMAAPHERKIRGTSFSTADR